MNNLNAQRAHLATAPVSACAGLHLLLGATQAGARAAERTRRAGAAVTRHLTRVVSTRQLLGADLGTRPLLSAAAADLRRLLAAEARDAHGLRTGRARARVAQQQAAVTALGPQRLAAHLTARVRHEPRVEARLLLLAAETVVASRAVELLVRVTALGTATPHMYHTTSLQPAYKVALI